MSTISRHVSAPRGAARSCKVWPQEAALRMLMNNLDPEVAERPDELIVYGGSGRAARSWEAFDAIVDALKRLENDETLVVQSGKPVAIFRTHPWSPRVIIANALLVPHRHAGHPPGHLRDTGGTRPASFWWRAGRTAGRDRRPRRHGRRAAARRHNERRHRLDHGSRRHPYRPAARNAVCRRAGGV